MRRPGRKWAPPKFSTLNGGCATRYVSPVLMAEVCAGLRRHADAFKWLECAVQDRTGALFPFKVDPRFDELRSVPEVQHLLELVHSPS